MSLFETTGARSMDSGLTHRPEGPGKCLLVVEDVVAMALCSAQPTAGISTDFAQRIARTFVDGVGRIGVWKPGGFGAVF